MKTTKINIRKITADEGKILISKNMIEIAEDLSFPESYGTEIYLAASADPADFEEVSIEHFEELQERVREHELLQQEKVQAEEDLVEQELEDSNDSN